MQLIYATLTVLSLAAGVFLIYSDNTDWLVFWLGILFLADAVGLFIAAVRD